MSRQLICLLLIGYAMVFAFAALTAVRWPSIVMIMGWMVNEDLSGGLQTVNWREAGLLHGGAYLVAAVCYYASGASLAGRRPGALVWYVLAMTASLPTLFLVHFDPQWWHDPSVGEGAMAGLAAGAVLLLLAVIELQRPPRRRPAPPQQAPARPDTADKPVRQGRHTPYFVPDIVVRRQQALFTAQAQRRRRKVQQARLRPETSPLQASQDPSA